MSPVGFDRSSKIRIAVLATFAAALALWLGFERLGAHPLWLDEAYTVHDASRSLGDIVFMHSDRSASVHPPLPYLVARPFVGACGASEGCLRMPSVLFFAATAACLVIASARAFGWSAAAFSTVFWPSLPYAIKYAQQVRAYTLLAFLTALSLVLWIRAVRLDGGPPPRTRTFVALGVVLGLAVSTHILATLWSVAVGLSVLVRLRRMPANTRPSRSAWRGLLVGFALASLPGWLGILAALGGSGSNFASSWGPAEHYPRLAFGLVTLGTFERTVPALLVVGVAYGAARRNWLPLGLLGVVVFSLGVFGVRSPAHFVTVRHLTPFVVVVALLASAGFAALIELPQWIAERWMPRVSSALPMLVGCGLGALALVQPIRFAKEARAKRANSGAFEPWDKAAMWVRERGIPGAVVVATPSSIVTYPLEVYDVGMPIQSDDIDALGKLLDEAPPPRVIVVWSHVSDRGRERTLNLALGELSKRGYISRAHRAFARRRIVAKVFDAPAR